MGIGLTDQDIVDQAWDLSAIAESYNDSLRQFVDLEVTEGDDALFTQIAWSTSGSASPSWIHASPTSYSPRNGRPEPPPPASNNCARTGTTPPNAVGMRSQTDRVARRASCPGLERPPRG